MRHVLPELLVTAVTIASAVDAFAQDRRQAITDARLDSIVRKVESLSPKSGTPGTVVTLRTGGMPALTPLRIGVGAVRFGFEEVGQVLTNERGEFSLDVAVPPWARRDLTHRFIVFDFYFVPIALSDVFHVTDSAGLLSRQGEIVNPRPPCPVLRADDGLLYALTGALSGFGRGSRVTVEGKIAESSSCPQATAIEVVRITGGAR